MATVRETLTAEIADLRAKAAEAEFKLQQLEQSSAPFLAHEWEAVKSFFVAIAGKMGL
jgi:hypothetical protein